MYWCDIVAWPTFSAHGLCLAFYLPPTDLCFRIQAALGMAFVAKADLTTGCSACSSFVLRSGEATLVITAPSYRRTNGSRAPVKCPLPGYDAAAAFEFIKEHGIAVRSIGATPFLTRAVWQVLESGWELEWQ
jgi:hypothetical protein